MLLRLAITISGFAFASAQSINISGGCLTALAGVASNPSAAACLNPSPLVSALLTGSNSSIVSPVNTWLIGLCADGPCSNTTLDAITTNLTAGCQTELGTLGIQNLSQALVQQTYPTVRNVLCLKDTANSTLCVTQTLNNLQNVDGTLTVSMIMSLIGSGLPQSLNASSVACTNCNKASYNLIKQQPALLGNTTTASLQNTCGASFVDGQTPAGISETASSQGTTSTNGSSGALGLVLPHSTGLGSVSAFMLVISALVFLP